MRTQRESARERGSGRQREPRSRPSVAVLRTRRHRFNSWGRCSAAPATHDDRVMRACRTATSIEDVHATPRNLSLTMKIRVRYGGPL